MADDWITPSAQTGDWITPTQPTQSSANADQGFSQNVKNDWNNRINKYFSDLPNSSYNSSLAHLGGQLAGGANDFLGEATKSLTPDWLTQGSHSLATSIDNTTLGQKTGDALLSTDNAVSDVLKANPTLANFAGDIGNVTSLATGAKGVSKAEGIDELGLGNKIYDSGKASQELKNRDYIQGLILPKETPTVKAEMVPNTAPGKGLLGKPTYNPTDYETQMISTIGQIPGVQKSNGILGNFHIIQNANEQEAGALKGNLMAANSQIPPDTILNTFANVRDNLAKATNISPAAKSTTANVLNAALEHVTSQPQTAAGMLEARKQFDAQIIREKGEGLLDPAIESPRAQAVAQIRQAMNQMVADAAPSVQVKNSLMRQNHMFTAMDNMAPKAAAEWPTQLGRAIQKYAPSNFKEGATGLIGLEGAKMLLPYVPTPAIGAGIAGYGLYKGITAPSTRMAIGKALGVSNGAP